MNSDKKSMSSSPSLAQIEAIYTSPLSDLVFKAQTTHRHHHNANTIQKSVLYSIKTGGCKEDCAYCAQSKHYQTGVKPTRLTPLVETIAKARVAKNSGASRFCMGASGTRVQNGKEFETILEMVSEVKKLGLESCATLGMLTLDQAKRLKKAGLDYYNHNIDTSRSHYKKIITTRSFEERIETLRNVRKAGLNICTGGILGMGETNQDRIEFIAELVKFSPPPESITINRLVPIAGTPLAKVPPIEWDALVRTIATLRILAPVSAIRLSAGRETMSESLQFLCFMAGANSIFSGSKLLTTPNRTESADTALFEKLGLAPQETPLHNQVS
ncbi:biotin synthase [Spirochaetota bacterium]|nr:biotin synthase [Spirochaetota bacterium]